MTDPFAAVASASGLPEVKAAARASSRTQGAKQFFDVLKNEAAGERVEQAIFALTNNADDKNYRMRIRQVIGVLKQERFGVLREGIVRDVVDLRDLVTTKVTAAAVKPAYLNEIKERLKDKESSQQGGSPSTTGNHSKASSPEGDGTTSDAVEASKAASASSTAPKAQMPQPPAAARVAEVAQQPAARAPPAAPSTATAPPAGAGPPAPAATSSPFGAMGPPPPVAASAPAPERESTATSGGTSTPPVPAPSAFGGPPPSADGSKSSVTTPAAPPAPPVPQQQMMNPPPTPVLQTSKKSQQQVPPPLATSQSSLMPVAPPPATAGAAGSPSPASATSQFPASGNPSPASAAPPSVLTEHPSASSVITAESSRVKPLTPSKQQTGGDPFGDVDPFGTPGQNPFGTPGRPPPEVLAASKQQAAGARVPPAPAPATSSSASVVPAGPQRAQPAAASTGREPPPQPTGTANPFGGPAPASRVAAPAVVQQQQQASPAVQPVRANTTPTITEAAQPPVVASAKPKVPSPRGVSVPPVTSPNWFENEQKMDSIEAKLQKLREQRIDMEHQFARTRETVTQERTRRKSEVRTPDSKQQAAFEKDRVLLESERAKLDKDRSAFEDRVRQWEADVQRQKSQLDSDKALLEQQKHAFNLSKQAASSHNSPTASKGSVMGVTSQEREAFQAEQAAFQAERENELKKIEAEKKRLAVEREVFKKKQAELLASGSSGAIAQANLEAVDPQLRAKYEHLKKEYRNRAKELEDVKMENTLFRRLEQKRNQEQKFTEEELKYTYESKIKQLNALLEEKQGHIKALEERIAAEVQRKIKTGEEIKHRESLLIKQKELLKEHHIREKDLTRKLRSASLSASMHTNQSLINSTTGTRPPLPPGLSMRGYANPFQKYKTDGYSSRDPSIAGRNEGRSPGLTSQDGISLQGDNPFSNPHAEFPVSDFGPSSAIHAAFAAGGSSAAGPTSSLHIPSSMVHTQSQQSRLNTSSMILDPKRATGGTTNSSTAEREVDTPMSTTQTAQVVENMNRFDPFGGAAGDNVFVNHEALSKGSGKVVDDHHFAPSSRQVSAPPSNKHSKEQPQPMGVVLPPPAAAGGAPAASVVQPVVNNATASKTSSSPFDAVHQPSKPSSVQPSPFDSMFEPSSATPALEQQHQRPPSKPVAPTTTSHPFGGPGPSAASGPFGGVAAPTSSKQNSVGGLFEEQPAPPTVSKEHVVPPLNLSRVSKENNATNASKTSSVPPAGSTSNGGPFGAVAPPQPRGTTNPMMAVVAPPAATTAAVPAQKPMQTRAAMDINSLAQAAPAPTSTSKGPFDSQDDDGDFFAMMGAPGPAVPTRKNSNLANGSTPQAVVPPQPALHNFAKPTGPSPSSQASLFGTGQQVQQQQRTSAAAPPPPTNNGMKKSSDPFAGPHANGGDFFASMAKPTAPSVVAPPAPAAPSNKMSDLWGDGPDSLF